LFQKQQNLDILLVKTKTLHIKRAIV